MAYCGILFTLNVLNLENKKLRKNFKAWYHLKMTSQSTWWIMKKSNFTAKWLQKVRKLPWLSFSKLFWLARNYWKTLTGIKPLSGIGLTKHLQQNINQQITLRKFSFVDHLIREILTLTADFVNYTLTNISYFLRTFSKFLHESNFFFAKINKKFNYELTPFLIMFIFHHR